MTTQTTEVKNGTIVLPPKLRRAWKRAQIFIFPSKDTLIVKKIEKPLFRLSELPSRISSKKMSQKEIEKEIQSFRRNK